MTLTNAYAVIMGFKRLRLSCYVYKYRTSSECFIISCQLSPHKQLRNGIEYTKAEMVSGVYPCDCRLTCDAVALN
jgi:hypothetical protein